MYKQHAPRFFITQCIAILLTCMTTAHAQTIDPYAQHASKRYQTARTSQATLKNWMQTFPKGGDLHNHLTGALYPSVLLTAVTQQNTVPWCLNPTSFALSLDAQCAQDGGWTAATFQKAYPKILPAWSMYQFPLAPPEYGHDHFFAIFGKESALARYYPAWPFYLSGLMQQATEQNIDYLVFQVKPDKDSIKKSASDQWADRYLQNFPTSEQVITYARVVEAIKTLDAKDFQKKVVQSKVILPVKTAIEGANQILQCADKTSPNPACTVTVRFLYEALRDNPLRDVFANLYAGFSAVKQSPQLFVGINLVEPEDNPIALTDYTAQMKLIQLLQVYFNDQFGITIPVSLHAGELTSNLVPQKALTFHINDAVKIAGAMRIGHGVDILQELTSHPDLLTTLRDQQIDVEINLTSNEDILGVCDQAPNCFESHPFPLYLKSGVPVTLSTDDQGIELTNLTREFVKAAMRYTLTYFDLKNIARNSIEFSFLPGKSLWQPLSQYQAFAPPCYRDNPYTHPTPTTTCAAYLKANKKAEMAWKLETQFSMFERRSERKMTNLDSASSAE